MQLGSWTGPMGVRVWVSSADREWPILPSKESTSLANSKFKIKSESEKKHKGLIRENEVM
jgi:hypothetical protein